MDEDIMDVKEWVRYAQEDYAGDASSNKAMSGNGHAVYVRDGDKSRAVRNTTAGPEVKLDTSKPGRSGGWEN